MTDFEWGVLTGTLATLVLLIPVLQDPRRVGRVAAQVAVVIFFIWVLAHTLAGYFAGPP